MTEKPTDLRVIYDPHTQRGMVLRLRKRLGRNFVLHYRPVGTNGGGEEEEEEEEEEFPLLELPAELISMITILLMADMTRQGAKDVFSLAATSTRLREFLNFPSLENTISLYVLGARHSRTREERRLGLEPDVALRYRGILNYIGTRPHGLQEIADKNAALYEKYGSGAYTGRVVLKEGKSRMRLDLSQRIESWPWWYLRLLSNRMSLTSMSNPFRPTSDGFSGSVVSLLMLRPTDVTRRPPTKFKKIIVNDAQSFPGLVNPVVGGSGYFLMTLG